MLQRQSGNETDKIFLMKTVGNFLDQSPAAATVITKGTHQREK